MVEGARLESVYRGNSIEGSNPSLSAMISPVASMRCEKHAVFTYLIRTNFPRKPFITERLPVHNVRLNFSADVLYLVQRPKKQNNHQTIWFVAK